MGKERRKRNTDKGSWVMQDDRQSWENLKSNGRSLGRGRETDMDSQVQSNWEKLIGGENGIYKV